jgi:DNA polymerase-3 subunit gamma/tau
MAFRQLVPLAAIEGKQPATNRNNQSEAKLIIEEGSSQKIKEPVQPSFEKPLEQLTKKSTGDNKLSALDKIRKQYKSNGNSGQEQINDPLKPEELRQVWDEYVQKLKEGRNPAAQPFELALLEIKDENSFEVITANNIEQKFIEQERNYLFAFLQQQLRNRSLQFTVIVRGNSEQQPKIEVPLSSREQFQKLTEQYPLVKDLKDRLKLELDY